MRWQSIFKGFPALSYERDLRIRSLLLAMGAQAKAFARLDSMSLAWLLNTIL